MITARKVEDVQKMNRAPYLFVRFKRDSCPHCIDSQPGWNDLAEKLKTHKLKNGYVVGEIEAEGDLMDAFKAMDSNGGPFSVGGVPAYEFFEKGIKKGTPSPGRDAASLFRALEEHGFIEKKGGSRRKRKKRGTRRRPKRRSRR